MFAAPLSPSRSKFEKKNPMIANMDYFDFHSANPDTVAARFATKQVEEMAKGALAADSVAPWLPGIVAPRVSIIYLRRP